MATAACSSRMTLDDLVPEHFAMVLAITATLDVDFADDRGITVKKSYPTQNEGTSAFVERWLVRLIEWFSHHPAPTVTSADNDQCQG